MEAKDAKPKKSRSFKITLYMAGALGIVLIIYVIYTWQHGLRLKEMPVHVKETRPSRSGITRRAIEALIGLIRLRVVLWREGVGSPLQGKKIAGNGA